MNRSAPRLRRLSDDEIASYEHLDPQLARRVRVATIPRLPGRYLGLTLGPIVLMQPGEPDDGTSALLAHELVHVRQWREQGTMRFAARYVGAFAANWWRCRHWNEAYRSIPAEIEARAEATRWWAQRQRPPEPDTHS